MSIFLKTSYLRVQHRQVLLYFKECINDWLVHKNSCPNDRQVLLPSHLKPVPRFMKNILDKLQIKCKFVGLGCNRVIKLESLRQHVSVCDFNPEKPIECESGCGLVIKKADINNHNCVKDLRKTVKGFIEENLKYDQLLTSVRHDINVLRNENKGLNDLVNNLRNDIKQIKQLVGIEVPLISQTTAVSCITSAQTISTSKATSTSIKAPERDSHVVPPNPFVLITPLRPSLEARLRSSDNYLIGSDEPSSSTSIPQSNCRLNNEEPAFKRRATAIRPIPTLRQMPSSLRLLRPYSPEFSSDSTRSMPNVPTLSPIQVSNDSSSEDNESVTAVTISNDDIHSDPFPNFITLENDDQNGKEFSFFQSFI